MAKRFLIYGVTGWGMEILWTGLGSLFSGDLTLSGFSNIWMFFIYGSAVFLEPLHDIMRNWRWPIRGIMWVIIIWGIEYASGLFLGTVLGVTPWSYTGPFAIDSLVRLDYGPAWFIAGLFFERLHKTLDAYNIA